MKKTISLLLVLVLMATLSACGGDAKNSTPPPSAPPTVVTTVPVIQITPPPTTIPPTVSAAIPSSSIIAPTPTLAPGETPTDGAATADPSATGEPVIERYSNKDLKFSGHAPTNFTEEKHGDTVSFLEKCPDSEFSTRLYVTLTKFKSSGSDLAKYAEKAGADMISKYKAELTNKRSAKLDGMSALEYTFYGESDLGSVRGRMIFTIHNNKLISIVYVTNKDKYEKHEDVYRRMRDKFKLTT